MNLHNSCPVLLLQNPLQGVQSVPWEDSSDIFCPNLHPVRTLFCFQCLRAIKAHGSPYCKKKKKPYFLHYHARQIKSKRKLSLSHYKRNNDVHDIWWFTRKQMDRKAEGKQLKYTGKLNKKECKLQAIYHGYCLHQADETPNSFPQCMWHIWHLVILTKMFLV